MKLKNGMSAIHTCPDRHTECPMAKYGPKECPYLLSGDTGRAGIRYACVQKKQLSIVTGHGPESDRRRP